MTATLPRIEKPSRFGSPYMVTGESWRTFEENVYQCRIVVDRDGDVFVARVCRLPNVTAIGVTVEQAVSNVACEFANAVRSYLDAGLEIPWGEYQASSVPDVVLLVRVDDETADILSDQEFMDGVRESAREFADGKTRSWESVKDELGL